MKLSDHAAISACLVMNGLLLLMVSVACSPPAMPCKYADTVAPQQYTGTFQITAPGMMHTGTLDVSLATDNLVDHGPLDSREHAGFYNCTAAVSGSMTFDDGRVVELTGSEEITVEYSKGTSLDGRPAVEAITLIAGDYFLSNGADLGGGGGFSGSVLAGRNSIGTWEIHE
jgi:hypothetical protein